MTFELQYWKIIVLLHFKITVFYKDITWVVCN